jgi:hypothetical protein
MDTQGIVPEPAHLQISTETATRLAIESSLMQTAPISQKKENYAYDERMVEIATTTNANFPAAAL